MYVQQVSLHSLHEKSKKDKKRKKPKSVGLLNSVKKAIRNKPLLRGIRECGTSAMKKEHTGYEKKKTTLQELLDRKLTKENSINALRARTRAILVYLENNGPTQYYDEQLSAIRSKAASECKRPGVFWKDIERAFKACDASNSINPLIIKNLNSGLSQQTVVEAVAKLIKDKLEA